MGIDRHSVAVHIKMLHVHIVFCSFGFIENQSGFWIVQCAKMVGYICCCVHFSIVLYSYNNPLKSFNKPNNRFSKSRLAVGISLPSNRLEIVGSSIAPYSLNSLLMVSERLSYNQPLVSAINEMYFSIPIISFSLSSLKGSFSG